MIQYMVQRTMHEPHHSFLDIHILLSMQGLYTFSIRGLEIHFTADRYTSRKCIVMAQSPDLVIASTHQVNLLAVINKSESVAA